MDPDTPEGRKQLAIQNLRAGARELEDGRAELAFYDSNGWIEMQPGKPEADVMFIAAFTSIGGFPVHLPPPEVVRIKAILERAMCDIRHRSSYECAVCRERRCMTCDRLTPHREEIKTAVRGCPTHALDVMMGRLP